MIGKKIRATIGICMGILLIGALGSWMYLRSAAFMESAGRMAAEKAAEMLGVPVEVGEITIDSLHSLTIRDIVLYDRQAECIARAGEARVSFRLLSMLREDPAAGVEEVILRHVDADLHKRAEGSWNVEDIETKGEGELSFRGKVRLEDGNIKGSMEGRSLQLENVTAGLDMADYPLLRAEVSAESHGGMIRAEGTISEERQIATAEVEGMELEPYLPLLPEGTIPENVKILSGKVPKGNFSLLRQYGTLSFSGQAEYEKGAVQVEDTRIEDIHGFASFTDSEVLLSTDAKAAGQGAHVQGRLRWDTGRPYMDLYAESDAFDPGEVLPTIPFHSPVEFKAHVTGSFQNPTVEGDFLVSHGEAQGISFQKGRAHVRFAENTLYLQKVTAGVFDGTVTGEGELCLDDMMYTAHVKAENLEASHLAAYVPDISGRFYADLGISGQGQELEGMEVYGSARAKDAFYRTLPITDLSTSFYAKGRDVTVDYLSLQMPNHSDIGLEGAIRNGSDLEFSFYGGHVDLSLFSHLVPQADITGWGDFKGILRGNVDNPKIGVKLSCLRGTLFRQPFDSLKASMGGSLDGVGIREFFMERDGREVWKVKGYAGFVGEKRIDLQADTVGARMEDIASLVAPDVPVTGSVDNTIHVTGTLDDPHAVGYIHMYRGSYDGMLIIGVDGDYFLEGDTLRVHDARIRTPMIDMDVSGTLNYKTKQMDMALSVYDIDMKRMESRFPYEVSGHGTFSGNATGSTDHPVFRGVLSAPEILLNGQSITDVHGQTDYEDQRLALKDFGFSQGEGTYRLDGTLGLEDNALSGTASIRNADINALAAILGEKNDVLNGKMNVDAVLGGTLDDPLVRVEGMLPQGLVAGYDVHDVGFKGSYLHHLLTVDSLSGAQGASGYFDAAAVIQREGPIQGKISAYGMESGIFTKLAGLDAKMTGASNVEAVFGGVLDNPSAEVSVSMTNGGIQGSAFDSLDGSFQLKNGLIDVRKLTVKKNLAGNDYQASAGGVVPLKALFAKSGEELSDYEQIKLHLALEHADLSLLPVLSDHIDWAIGPTQGGVEITGTLAHPLVKGSLLVPDGSVKIKKLEVPLTNMRIALKFNGNQVELEECSGNMGEGSYHVTGSMVFQGREAAQYTLQADMDRLDVRGDFYRGPLTGSFHVNEAEITPLPGRTRILPKVSGNLHLENCMISVPTIPETQGDLPEILMDVTLDLGKKVRFYSAHLYDMYLDGSAHFEGSTKHPKTSGTISVKWGGTFTYLKTVFNIRTGELQFNQVDSFMPSIAFFADSRLGRTKIYLWARGPMGGDRLNLRLTSSPEMSQTEIMNLLTFRSASEDRKSGVDMGGILLTGLQMSILSELENSMRDMLYLDVFSVSYGLGSTFGGTKADDKEYYSLTVGKYISDKVMLKYSHGFGSGSDRYLYGFTYDLTERFGLTFERKGKENIFGVEARVKF